MATTIDRSQPPAGAPEPQRDMRGGRERPIGGFELWASGGVDRVDFGFVAARWNSPFWRTWDWMLLTLALIHGINGLRNITLDYVRKPGMRFALNMAYYVLGFTLLILGTVIVVTFDPTKWGPVA